MRENAHSASHVPSAANPQLLLLPCPTPLPPSPVPSLSLFKQLNSHPTPHQHQRQISLGLFPEPAFHSDDFLTVIAASLALFFVLAFLYPVSRYIRALVLEKETKIKEVRPSMCSMCAVLDTCNADDGRIPLIIFTIHRRR